MSVPIPVSVPVSASASASAGPPRFEMTGNLLTFNGLPLRFEDRLETWTRVLGAPSSSRTSCYGWYARTVEVCGARTADGRVYVTVLRVRLGEHDFPGVFVLQGVPISRGAPSFKGVQAALEGTETPLWGRGGDRMPEDGRMEVHRPDGFSVGVGVHLDCPNPPRETEEDCVQTIAELEIWSEW